MDRIYNPNTEEGQQQIIEDMYQCCMGKLSLSEKDGERLRKAFSCIDKKLPPEYSLDILDRMEKKLDDGEWSAYLLDRLE